MVDVDKMPDKLPGYVSGIQEAAYKDVKADKDGCESYHISNDPGRHGSLSREQAALGKPENPDFLLNPGELFQWFKDWEVLDHHQGLLEYPERYMAGIVARKPGSHEGVDGISCYPLDRLSQISQLLWQKKGLIIFRDYWELKTVTR